MQEATDVGDELTAEKTMQEEGRLRMTCEDTLRLRRRLDRVGLIMDALLRRLGQQGRPRPSCLLATCALGLLMFYYCSRMSWMAAAPLRILNELSDIVS